MRPALLTFLGSLLIAGCVPSFHPIYSEGETVFDPNLVGDWESRRGPFAGHWRFTRQDDGKAYQLEYTQQEKTDSFSVNLVRIGDRRYVDISPRESMPAFERLSMLGKFHIIPAHTFAQIEVDEDQATIAFLNPEWLDDLLRDNPSELSHEKNKGILITANTEELQAFVKQHASVSDAWKPKVQLSRSAER